MKVSFLKAYGSSWGVKTRIGFLVSSVFVERSDPDPYGIFENFRLLPLPFVTPDVTLHRETVSAILVELRGSTL